MCVKEGKLSNMAAVQLMKDYTSEGATGAVVLFGHQLYMEIWVNRAP